MSNIANIDELRKPSNGTGKDIITLLEHPKMKAGIKHVVGQVMSPDRLLRLATGAIKRTPKLQLCDPQTVLGCVMTAAALGLEPNTPLQHAWLIPYNKRRKEGRNWVDFYECQIQIGYRGFVTIAGRAHIALDGECIRENDFFDYQKGTSPFLNFKANLADRGQPIGSYAISKQSNEYGFTVLSLSDIHKARDKSETYRYLLSAEGKEKQLNETPWVLWFDDMATKTAVKKRVKLIPMESGTETAALGAAVEIDSMADMGKLDTRMMVDPDAAADLIQGGNMPVIEHDDEGEAVDVAPTNEIPERLLDTLNDLRDMEPAKAQQKLQASKLSPEDKALLAAKLAE